MVLYMKYENRRGKNEFLFLTTSGTPPTRVLTVNNPQLAASNMAMQKASVKELQEW